MYGTLQKAIPFVLLYILVFLYILVRFSTKGDSEREETADGLELVMASNHFGHFLLTSLLLPHLKRTADAALSSGTPAPRVIVVSSLGHRAFFPFQADPVLDIDENGDDLNVPHLLYLRVSYLFSIRIHLLFFKITFSCTADYSIIQNDLYFL